MSPFWGVVSYEYRMAVRRLSMWIAFALPAAYYVYAVVAGELREEANAPALALAGSLALGMNMLMPIVGGIVMADRLSRDFRLGTRELLASTPLRLPAYVLGKYVGVVAATVTPVLTTTLLMAAVVVVRGLAAGLDPLKLAGLAVTLPLGFLAINLPAYLFVGAFALACTAVLPVRVFQVLYTGYWFWGNYLNPKFIPTLADTPLTPSGKYVAGALFSAGRAGTGMWVGGYTVTDAVLNLVTLFACAALALFALERYLAWQARRA